MSVIDTDPSSIPLRDRVRTAVFWRSGSQIVGQLIAWASTFLVIRLLRPEDYGLFAMATVVLVFLHLMNGYGFASSLIQRDAVSRKEIRQVFGLLILLNLALALVQFFILAPLAAEYFRQPEVLRLLRVQSVLYFATPFVALPFALLSRELEYRKQAYANLAGAIIGAIVALTLAIFGFGVWTLVYAPIAALYVRAFGLTYAARSLMLPSFSFKGAGTLIAFGGAMTATQIFWFLQSQSDVFIGGRIFDAHTLGLYTTSLFLAQILVAKFVPPLNDVAFAAYSRMYRDGQSLAPAFAAAVRMIMLVATPFYLGLAVTAEYAVTALLGPQWLEIIPVVQLICLAMPVMALQILFAPATNASGRPWVAVRVNIGGACIMATAFLIGVQYGIEGMARAWLVGMPVLLIYTMALSLPIIGIGLRNLAKAVWPGLAASLAMAASVVALETVIVIPDPFLELTFLATTGVIIYAAILLLFARPLVDELMQMVLKRNSTVLENAA